MGSIPVASAAAAPPLDPPALFVSVVRIQRRAEQRVVGVRSHREFGDVGLPDRDRAGRAQPFDEDRVLGRHVVREDARAAGPRKADGRLVVLECDRQAVERANGVAARQPPVSLVREREARLVRQL